MKRFTAAGIGEILWDVLPDTRKLGGAPANFAYHFGALGGLGVPMSRVGDDALGREALALLSGVGLDVSHVSVDPERPTGRVDVTINRDGVASYVFPDDVAWDYLDFSRDLKFAASCDAVCFGTLAQRSPEARTAIRDFLAASGSALKVLDANLRQNFHSADLIREALSVADVLKVSDEELPAIAAMFSMSGDERTVMRRLMERHDLKLVVLTRGAWGSLVLSRDAESDLPGARVRVGDTIGSGDAFTAAMTLGMLVGLPLDEMHAKAAEVAAYVCTQHGAMPPMPKSLSIL